MSFVITGASGNLGRRTAELLLDQVDPTEVLLVTRTPDALSDLAARGAVVRHGDFNEPSELPAAFAGGERMLIISGDDIGARTAQHIAAIEAAKAAGVGHVAYTSIVNPVDDNPAAVVPSHKATEEALAASGLGWTFLRNGLYSEFRIDEAAMAKDNGSFHHNLGDGQTAYVSRDDCAAAAAAVLSGGSEHDGQIYNITGPALLGAAELAELYGRVGGTPVEAINVPDDGLIQGMIGAGLPEFVAGLIASFGTAIRGGYLNERSDAVEKLTGRPPVTLESVLRGAA
jgi:NAD(P)H dehydrogenase (quinone)